MSFHKRSKSKTHPGDMDFTTKKGNVVYYSKGHNVKKTHKPFSFHKRSKSKSYPGDMDFITKKGNLDYKSKGHYIKKSKKPYSSYKINGTRKNK